MGDTDTGLDARDSDPADTDVADTDPGDTDATDTDPAADTDSGVLADTDLADADSGVLVDTDVVVDTDVFDTDSGALVDTDVADTDPPLVDADHDGFDATVDCDDEDPSVNPGAVQRCDGVDRTCGRLAVDPDGTAAVMHDDGAWVDLTDLFAAGTSGVPTEYTTVTDDTVRLCGGDWSVALSLAEGTDLIGVHQPTIIHGASRSGIVASEGTSVVGVDLDLSATDVPALEANGTASFAGGAIHGAMWAVYVTGSGALTLDDVLIHDTTGAAISLWSGGSRPASVTVHGSTITRVGRAAIQTYGVTSATLTDVEILDAVQGVAGGAATLSLTGVTMTLVDQAFDANGTTIAVLDHVSVDGAIQRSGWYAGALTVTGSTFKNGAGWLVSSPDPATAVLFDDCVFDAMDGGTNWGGAMYVAGAHVVVTGSQFTNGYGYYGGAILSVVPMEVSDCTFTGNRAASGGALYLGYAGGAASSVTDCTFTDNAASWGGAVYTEGAATLLRDTFTGNKAVAGGGGVYMSASGTAPTTVTDSSFESNQAETGGGVCATRLTTSGNTWRGNTATTGGAIYAFTPRDNLHLSGDAFYANAAAQYGGAVGWGWSLSGVGLIFGAGADANLPAEGSAQGLQVPLASGDVTCSFATCTVP